MSLKEIARFADLPEAQIAASRLRAEGVHVLVQNEYWGGADFIMTIAMGGFRLWAPEGQAAEAKALISELRANAPPPEAFEPEGDVFAPPPVIAASSAVGIARTSLALLLTLLFGGAAGLLLAGRRRPVAVIGAVVVLMVISGLSLAVIAWTWLIYVAGS